MTGGESLLLTRARVLLASSAPPMSEDSLDRRAHDLGRCLVSGDVLPALLATAPSLPHWTQRVVILRSLAHARPDQRMIAASMAALMLYDADLAVATDAITALVSLRTVEAMRALALFLGSTSNAYLRDHARDLLSC